MFKKGLIKKLAVLGMALAMTLSMAACGDKDKNDTTEEKTTTQTEVTTEATTEEVTTEEPTTEEDAEEVTTESYYEENGKLTVKQVTIDLPEGFKFYQDMNGTIAYATETGDKSFALYAEDDNIYQPEQVVDAYVAQVKNVYGEHVTESEKIYNGHKFTIMDISAADGSFFGRAAVICEGENLVYIEYLDVNDDLSGFESIMNSMKF